MKAVIQRVKKAAVFVKNKKISQIKKGCLVFLAIEKIDEKKQADWLARKIVNLRFLNDNFAKMNYSLKQKNQEVLVVSQFTLAAFCQKGNRPDFSFAANKEKGKELYNYFIEKIRKEGIRVKSGKFGALMEVKLTNDGPVTFILEK